MGCFKCKILHLRLVWPYVSPCCFRPLDSNYEPMKTLFYHPPLAVDRASALWNTKYRSVLKKYNIGRCFIILNPISAIFLVRRCHWCSPVDEGESISFYHDMMYNVCNRDLCVSLTFDSIFCLQCELSIDYSCLRLNTCICWKGRLCVCQDLS